MLTFQNTTAPMGKMDVRQADLRTILVLIAIIFSDSVIVMEQFQAYSFYGLTDTVKHVVLIVAVMMALFATASNHNVIIDKRMGLASFFILYLTCEMTYSNTLSLSNAYFVLTEYALLVCWCGLLQSLTPDNWRIVWKIQTFVFLISFIGYCVARTTEVFFTDATHNSIMYLLMLLPLVFMGCRYKWTKLLVVLCVIFASLAEEKRTVTIICLVIAAIIIFGSSKNPLRLVLDFTILIIALVTAYSIVSSFLGADILRRTSAIAGATGDISSGRSEIYNTLLSVLSKSNLPTFLFGRGAWAASQFNGGLAAHNDFLESLIDFGLIGMLFYVWVFISFFIASFKSCASQTELIATISEVVIVVLFSASNSLFYSFGSSLYVLFFFAAMDSLRNCRRMKQNG